MQVIGGGYGGGVEKRRPMRTQGREKAEETVKRMRWGGAQPHQVELTSGSVRAGLAPVRVGLAIAVKIAPRCGVVSAGRFPVVEQDVPARRDKAPEFHTQR